jgi:hypothetical protein
MSSLSDMVRTVMISPPAPQTSMSAAGACSDWELVLHAFSTENWTWRIRWPASCISNDAKVAPAK